MIRIKFYVDERGHYRGFLAVGHAGLSEKGTDILCAGVSSALMLTANIIEGLCGKHNVNFSVVTKEHLKFTFEEGCPAFSEYSGNVFDALKLQLLHYAKEYNGHIELRIDVI